MDDEVKQRILNLCAELGEDLDSPACQTLRQLVAQCPNCQAFVDSVKKTIRLYQLYRTAPGADLRRRLFRSLHLE